MRVVYAVTVLVEADIDTAHEAESREYIDEHFTRDRSGDWWGFDSHTHVGRSRVVSVKRTNRRIGRSRR